MNTRQSHDDSYLGNMVTIETAVRLIVGDLERMTESELVQLLLRARNDHENPLVSRVVPLVHGELARRGMPVASPTDAVAIPDAAVSTWHG